MPLTTFFFAILLPTDPNKVNFSEYNPKIIYIFWIIFQIFHVFASSIRMETIDTRTQDLHQCPQCQRDRHHYPRQLFGLSINKQSPHSLRGLLLLITQTSGTVCNEVATTWEQPLFEFNILIVIPYRTYGEPVGAIVGILCVYKVRGETQALRVVNHVIRRGRPIHAV